MQESRRRMVLLCVVAAAVFTGCPTPDPGPDTAPQSGEAAAPSFSVPAGSYPGLLDIAVTSTASDALIRYTLDGTEPSPTHGDLYAGAVEIFHDCTLKAVAYYAGGNVSTVTEAAYTFTTVGTGSPVSTRPGWQERLAMVYVNALRMAPQQFKTAYAKFASDAAALKIFTAQPPLVAGDAMNTAARDHALDMSSTGVLDHNSSAAWADAHTSGDITFLTRILYYYPGAALAGENFGMGYMTPLSYVVANLDDPAVADDPSGTTAGHRLNMMRAVFTQMGTGYAASGRFWTTDFLSNDPGAVPAIPGAGHDTLDAGETSFLLDFYDSTQASPRKVLLVLDGVEQAMPLDIGTAWRGTYRVDLPAAAACRSYSFLVALGSGDLWRYPASGVFHTREGGSCTVDYQP